MATTFEKLNLKNLKEIVVLNSPASFEDAIAGLAEVVVNRSLDSVSKLDFVLAFVTRQSEVDALVAPILSKAQGDALVWFAYPKGTSKKYTCDFNRDTGWAALKAKGFDTVRAVAIDEDWTALRFRRIEYIKSK